MRALGVSDPLLDEGLDELVRVVEAAREHAPGLLVAQLKIARGLDYYTGTVYETMMAGYERAGSVCSGGRYDNLASIGDREVSRASASRSACPGCSACCSARTRSA